MRIARIITRLNVGGPAIQALLLTSGLDPAQWIDCGSPEAASKALLPILQEGDAVLIKGSHGVHLEKCVADFGF